MATALPFLYQTRTIWRSRRATAVAMFASKPRPDNSIPFVWGKEGPPENVETPAPLSTITPSEAHIFKSIFDEISQGKMPKTRKQPLPEPKTILSKKEREVDPGEDRPTRSIVEEARMSDFRDKVLQRYPASLRNAAQVALGLYEDTPSPGQRAIRELEEADQQKWEERAKYEEARSGERARVGALMKECSTDAELWEVLEKEVFSLPAKLGIAQEAERKAGPPKKAKGTTAKPSKDAPKMKKALKQDLAAEQKRVMDIHGPLYSIYLSTALTLFDTTFARLSPYAFQILPRVKQLGLPSYVLGVSTPLYTRLAKMHWERFGDAISALDTLQEMNGAGLYPDQDVAILLDTIKEHIQGCSWGVQGPLARAVTESPPYDGALMERLDQMQRFVYYSLDVNPHES